MVKPDVTPDRLNLGTFRSPLVAIHHALALPFTDRTLLLIALNLLSTINTISTALRSRAQDGSLGRDSLIEAVGPLQPDVIHAREMLRAYLPVRPKMDSQPN